MTLPSYVVGRETSDRYLVVAAGVMMVAVAAANVVAVADSSDLLAEVKARSSWRKDFAAKDIMRLLRGSPKNR